MSLLCNNVTEDNTKKITPYIMLVVFTTSIMIGFFGISSIPSIAPLIKKAMSLNPAQLGALMVSFYIGTSIMAFSYSLFLSNQKVKVSLLIGLTIIGSFIILASFTHQFWLFFLLLSIAGSGYGIITPAINKGIVAWIPQKLRGTAMSFKQVGVMLGGSFGAGILPPLALNFGISQTLILTGLLTILAGVFVFSFYKDKEIINQSIVNMDSCQIHDYGFRDIIKNHNIILLTATGMILVGAQFSFFMYLSLYLNNDFDYNVVLAGSLLSIASLGGAIGRVTWGSISDFLLGGDRKKVLLIITTFSFLLCIVLAVIPVEIPLIFMGSLVFIYGMLVGGWNGVLQVFVIELVEPENAGVVSGFNLAFLYLANMVLPLLFGLLIEYLGSYRVSWFISASTLLVAIVLLFFVKEEKMK